MRLSLLLLFFIVLLALAWGHPAKGSTKASLRKKCSRECTTEYKPVCAGDGTGKNKSFGNQCVLENYNCEMGANLRVIQQGECPGGGGIRLQ